MLTLALSATFKWKNAENITSRLVTSMPIIGMLDGTLRSSYKNFSNATSVSFSSQSSNMISSTILELKLDSSITEEDSDDPSVMHKHTGINGLKKNLRILFLVFSLVIYGTHSYKSTMLKTNIWPLGKIKKVTMKILNIFTDFFCSS